jgi:thiol-disulfide isomerase/thioredoxin
MNRHWRNLLVLTVLVLLPIVVHSAVTSFRGHVLGNAYLQILAQPRAVEEFSFSDRHGRLRTLADLRGRYVLLNVWATWCPPCREEMPSLDRLKPILEKDTDITVVALSVDRAGFEQLQAFYDVHGVTNLALYRGDEQTVLSALSIHGLPTTLLLDRKGQEVARLIGPTDWGAPDVIENIMEIYE